MRISYPLPFSGHVISGLGRGKKLGFPTVNLDPDESFLFPFGVYAAFVFENCFENCSENARKFPALVHFGSRPTFASTNASFEIYFFDFPKRKRFQKVFGEILGKIRDVRKFSSVLELISQIERDKQQAMVKFFA